MDVIRFSGVHCQRGRKKQKAYALRGVDFSIEKGKCVCLLGPNGAGKSTAMSLILGLLHPTQGFVQVLGGRPTATGVRRRIGCTPQDSEFLPYTTVKEVLGFVAAHYQVKDISEIVKRFKLDPILHRQTRALSGGQRRLLALACAFVGQPEIIVLDEPTTGLDPELRRDLWEAIRKYQASGGTVLLTTHYLEEAETLADHVIVIDQGRIRTQGTIQDIKAQLGYRRILFDSRSRFELPTELVDVCQVEQAKSPTVLTSSDSDRVVKYITANLEFSNLRIEELTLEEVMVRVWKGSEADARASV